MYRTTCGIRLIVTDKWANQNVGPTKQSPFSPNQSLPQTPYRLQKEAAEVRERDREKIRVCGVRFCSSVSSLTPAVGARGNQRERDRERAQARKPNAKGPQDGLTPEQRRERDKKALEEKAAKKAAQAAGGGGGTSTDSKNKAGGGKK
ncbi:hypothetical protein E2562_039381 [Oryza meyeriana var. granulata]|uniref:Small EDRK-rich factor-like N-terminal domain-containing protein n=1 Tax=Oryza meyeriana var. granulata TaxID=110450 RepID=A0A6G1CBK5_9ORYZ|nr:hypothetical protein E2562_039381 [Oryza meyeriana var. granulata]